MGQDEHSGYIAIKPSFGITFVILCVFQTSIAVVALAFATRFAVSTDSSPRLSVNQTFVGTRWPGINYRVFVDDVGLRLERSKFKFRDGISFDSRLRVEAPFDYDISSFFLSDNGIGVFTCTLVTKGHFSFVLSNSLSPYIELSNLDINVSDVRIDLDTDYVEAVVQFALPFIEREISLIDEFRMDEGRVFVLILVSIGVCLSLYASTGLLGMLALICRKKLRYSMVSYGLLETIFVAPGMFLILLLGNYGIFFVLPKMFVAFLVFCV